MNEGLIDISDKGLYSKTYIPIISDRQRYILMYGGRDSAKSYTAAQKVIFHCLNERYFKCVCLRKIFADIRDSQMETLWSVIESWGLQDYFKYTVSPLRIVCTLNNNQILARGLDRPAKLKSIKDITHIWAEEADEIALSDFVTSDTSIRSSYSNALLQFILTFNPESEEGWINSYFFKHKSEYEKDDGSHTYIESSQPDTTILHTTYKHNEFCPQARGDRYERLKITMGEDDNFYRVFCLGLWGNALKGLVFDKVKYATKFPERSECKIHGYGLDYGFTNDPTAIIECALAHGELWFREICYKTGLVNTGKHSIEAELKQKDVKSQEEIIAESAEPKSNAEIKRAGFNIKPVSKGKGSVEAGISSMKQYPINIVGSPNMKKEAKSYKYALDKEGEPTNKPIDAWNHAWDAARYWFMERVMKPKKEIRVISM
jgi:phage terminase large subunit